MSQRIQLLSGNGFHTPTFLRWGRVAYATRVKKSYNKILSESFELAPDVAEGLLSGKIRYEVEGDSVAFWIPPSTKETA